MFDLIVNCFKNELIVHLRIGSSKCCLFLWNSSSSFSVTLASFVFNEWNFLFLSSFSDSSDSDDEYLFLFCFSFLFLRGPEESLSFPDDSSDSEDDDDDDGWRSCSGSFEINYELSYWTLIFSYSSLANLVACSNSYSFFIVSTLPSSPRQIFYLSNE